MEIGHFLCRFYKRLKLGNDVHNISFLLRFPSCLPLPSPQPTSPTTSSSSSLQRNDSSQPLLLEIVGGGENEMMAAKGEKEKMGPKLLLQQQ
jgi:hypothetical protein